LRHDRDRRRFPAGGERLEHGSLMAGKLQRFGE